MTTHKEDSRLSEIVGDELNFKCVVLLRSIKAYNNNQSRPYLMLNSHKVKVCASCGKAEGKNWARHWKKYHVGVDVKELPLGGVPTDPYDESWLYLIQPLSLRE